MSKVTSYNNKLSETRLQLERAIEQYQRSELIGDKSGASRQKMIDNNVAYVLLY